MSKASKRPAWWPTAEQKVHADAGCAHPDECKVDATTQYAVRWPDGEVQGPVSAEFAKGVQDDRDLGPTVTILRRQAVTTFGEWAEVSR